MRNEISRSGLLAACLRSAMLSWCLMGAAAVQAEEVQDNMSSNPATPITIDSLKNFFNSVKTFLGGSVAELRDLVDKGDLDNAYALYANKQADFDKSDDTVPVLEKLAAALNQRNVAQWQSLTAQLRSIDPKAGPKAWPEWRSTVASADAELKKNMANPLLSQERYQSVESKALAQAYGDAVRRLAAVAPSYFVAYDFSAQPNFFEAYPSVFTNAEQQRLVLEKLSPMADALSSYGTARAALALKNYLPMVDDKTARQQLIQGWLNAYAREKYWKSMTIAQKLEAGGTLKTMVPDAEVRTTIALLPVFDTGTSSQRRDFAKTRLEELAKRLDADMQPEANASEALQQVANLRSRYSFVVLADVGRLHGKDVVVGTAKQQGRFLTRNDVTPNPERQRLMQDLAEAESKAREAEAADKQAQQQAKALISTQSQGMALAGLVGATTSIFSAGNAREEVDRLRRQVNNTPSMISKPVYENYERGVTTHKVTVVAPVALYFIDTGSNAVQRVLQPLVESREYITYDKPHPADPDVKPMTQEEKLAQRNDMIRHALTTLPDGLPSLDKVVAQKASFTFERLPKAMAEDQARFLQEADKK